MQQNNGLDRSQLISFMVFTLIMIAAMYYFQSTQAPAAENEATKTEQVTNAKTNENSPEPIISEEMDPSALQPVQLGNDEINIEFDPKGGQVSKVQLLKYKSYNKDTDFSDLPLYLIKENNSKYGFEFKDNQGRMVSTKNMYFAPTVDGNTVTMTHNSNGITIQFIYTLKPDYVLDFQVKTNGLSKLTNARNANFVWDYTAQPIEKGRSQEREHTEFSYAFDNYSEYDYDGRGEMDETEETLNWIGVKQQFFASLIEAKDGFKQSTGEQISNDEEEGYLKQLSYTGEVPFSGNEINQQFTWYYLPLDLPLLKKFDKNFDEIIPFGWSFIGAMNRYFFIPLYNWIASWGIQAGWVIFLMTIFVKLILSPIMFKQHKLSAMMRVIRPEIDEVNEKYKDADPMKKQQEMMSVYRKAGVNQMAGCLPALLQVPIFYALFRFFPNFITLRGQSFWVANDLTAYDDFFKLPFSLPILGDHISLLALLCTATILIYTTLTSGNMQQPTQPGMPNMKVLMYIFPITFLFFLNNSASGLSWYYFVSNAINIVIILVIKYWILDEDKIHAQIQANKAKPKKEGKFQKRMREMMEQAQAQQETQQKGKKK